MDLLYGDNQPATCRALGLECAVCMRKAAASVAMVCPNADLQGVQQIFFALFPSAGCRPMVAEFASAYQELSAAVVAAAAAA